MAGETAAGFFLGGGGAGLILEKRATVLNVAGVEGEGAGREAPPKLTGFPSISDLPRAVAAVDVAREAMLGSFTHRETEEPMADERMRSGDTICVVWWTRTCHVGFMFVGFDWCATEDV